MCAHHHPESQRRRAKRRRTAKISATGTSRQRMILTDTDTPPELNLLLLFLSNPLPPTNAPQSHRPSRTLPPRRPLLSATTPTSPNRNLSLIPPKSLLYRRLSFPTLLLDSPRRRALSPSLSSPATSSPILLPTLHLRLHLHLHLLVSPHRPTHAAPSTAAE